MISPFLVRHGPGELWALASGKHSQFAVENGPVEIVDLPSNKMVMFHSYVNVYQSVSLYLIRDLRTGPTGDTSTEKSR